MFDRAHERQGDVATLIEEAQQLGYPVRYWWLSEAMELREHPDRLIVCVHHPASAADAGMDLYETLKEHEITWDDMEAAALGEYRYFGKPIEGPEITCRPGGTALLPPAAGDLLAGRVQNCWRNGAANQAKKRASQPLLQCEVPNTRSP